MKRHKRKGWRSSPLSDLIFFCIIAGTIGIVGALAATPRAVDPTEATVPTEQAEAPATEPTETQPETAATEPPVTLYAVPMSEELQLHIIQTSEAHGIDPAVVIGVIWKESRYVIDAIGDGGDSLGLMQIQPKWHSDRMDRLGCPDLLDPFQNVTVGVDILAGLISKYDGSISMALMAYNAGPTGANRHWFSKGIYSNSYSEAVLDKAAELAPKI